MSEKITKNTYMIKFPDAFEVDKQYNLPDSKNKLVPVSHVNGEQPKVEEGWGRVIDVPAAIANDAFRSILKFSNEPELSATVIEYLGRDGKPMVWVSRTKCYPMAENLEAAADFMNLETQNDLKQELVKRSNCPYTVNFIELDVKFGQNLRREFLFCEKDCKEFGKCDRTTHCKPVAAVKKFVKTMSPGKTGVQAEVFINDKDDTPQDIYVNITENAKAKNKDYEKAVNSIFEIMNQYKTKESK